MAECPTLCADLARPWIEVPAARICELSGGARLPALVGPSLLTPSERWCTRASARLTACGWASRGRPWPTGWRAVGNARAPAVTRVMAPSARSAVARERTSARRNPQARMLRRSTVAGFSDATCGATAKSAHPKDLNVQEGRGYDIPLGHPNARLRRPADGSGGRPGPALVPHPRGDCRAFLAARAARPAASSTRATTATSASAACSRAHPGAPAVRQKALMRRLGADEQQRRCAATLGGSLALRGHRRRPVDAARAVSGDDRRCVRRLRCCGRRRRAHLRRRSASPSARRRAGSRPALALTRESRRHDAPTYAARRAAAHHVRRPSSVGQPGQRRRRPPVARARRCASTIERTVRAPAEPDEQSRRCRARRWRATT